MVFRRLISSAVVVPLQQPRGGRGQNTSQHALHNSSFTSAFVCEGENLFQTTFTSGRFERCLESIPFLKRGRYGREYPQEQKKNISPLLRHMNYKQTNKSNKVQIKKELTSLCWLLGYTLESFQPNLNQQGNKMVNFMNCCSIITVCCLVCLCIYDSCPIDFVKNSSPFSNLLRAPSHSLVSLLSAGSEPVSVCFTYRQLHRAHYQTSRP